MVNYDWRTSTFTAVGFSTGVLILPENNRRVAFSVSCDKVVVLSSAVAFLSLKADGAEQFLAFAMPNNIVLPWRDYGPIIQRGIYLRSTDVGATFVVCETYRIG